MKNKHEHRIWYVYSCDGYTNRAVFLELNPIECVDVEVEDLDKDKQKVLKKLNLARLNSYDEVQLLNKSKKSLRLNFKVFIQDDPDGKVYRWPFDEGLQPKKSKKPVKVKR